MPMLKTRLLPLLCGLLAACAPAPKAPPSPPTAATEPQPGANLLIATPVNESGPASLSARVLVKQAQLERDPQRSAA